MKPTTENSSPVGNVAAIREALESFCTIAESDVQELVCLSKCLIDEDIYGGGIIQKLVSDIGKARAALSAPPRNCDRLQGDGKKLNAEWFDWTGTPDGQNADGTVKLSFPEWLLAAAKKGGAQ